MIFHRHTGLSAFAIVVAVAASTATGCFGEQDEDMGSIAMELQIAPGVTLNTLNWTISNTGTGFTRSATVNVRFLNTVSFLVGAIPAADGYTIALSGTSVDGAFSCTGSANFSVTTRSSTSVGLTLNCSTAPAGQGSIVVVGTTQICANLDSISAAPLEAAVNTQIALSATGSAGSLPVTFAWTASAGAFDNAASATPVFTCPSTPGPVTISATVSPSAPTCNTTFSQSVVVNCVTLAPTFTNVHATIIAPRCVGCHRPGGSGVNVGMLDLSTQTAAHNNLVGVPGQGIGAGTSGVTCAALSPAMIRVVPGDPTASLLYNKVHSKVIGALAACGSPMPLGPAVLTAAEDALIAAWITAGAPND